VELIKKFNTAEDLFSRQQYDEAVNTFLEIAGQDSADIYGEKSLYAVAYIYEKYIDNVDSAVYYYKKLMEEFPGTKYAKIAMAKTKEPPPEKSVSDSLAAASDSSVIVQSADTLKTGKGIVTEEKDNMDKDKKNVSGFKTGKLKGRIPENDKLK
jgi:tetratricopeptide (TPR) repeat protein